VAQERLPFPTSQEHRIPYVRDARDERGKCLVDQPPESGIMEFSIPFGPISLQAHSSRKRVAQENFQRHLPSTNFLLSGDVKVEIEWLIHEAARYESDAAPDIDNILKPLMDVLCGPNGILIDDNQVQSVTCSWIDWALTDERLDFQIRFSPDDFVRKDGLIFIELANSLCMPINKNVPPEGLRTLLQAFKMQWKTRRGLEKLGMDYYQAKGVMSIQRVFHRSRLGRFPVVAFETILEETNQNVRDRGGC
jgi:Holliday junction resolvase RusA-like endonuclease